MKRILILKRPRPQVEFLFISVAFVLYFTNGCLGAEHGTKKLDIQNAQKEVQKPVANLQNTNKLDVSSTQKPETPRIDCPEKDKECEKDKLGFDAIKMLHLLIDDDHNGNVDQSESDEFLRDELQYTDGFERHSLFHNNDKLISVDDLWKAWKYSIVYNWTVDDVIEWLVQDVDLPQYSQMFHNSGIDGSVLPRLVNSTGPLLASLGIRNPVHKQKLSLKAMDTVLFGAPKKIHSYIKDVMLFLAVLLAIGISWLACLHHRYSQTQVKKMMKDLESLQKAEDALKKLSKELADAEKSQISMPHDMQEELRILRKNSLRLKVPLLPNAEKAPNNLSREGSVYRRQEGERKLKQAEEELASLREALSEAENRLEIQQQLETQWSVPGELQAWLQLTHELEQVHYNAKRQAAERQLLAARDGCDKIKRRNKAFFGSLRMAHSNSLDDIDQSILDARAALEEVKQDLQERLHRWHTIEILCGFSVISNPGLSALKQALGRENSSSGPRLPGSLLAPVSIDEADEDLPPTAFLSTLQNNSTARPRALSTAPFHRDESKENNNVYNQIPERQRQQIYAWARRSRINSWMKKKTLTNGYSTTTLPSMGKPSFHKQQTLTGSTGSLSHVGKVSSSSSGGCGHGRSGSRDNELQELSSMGNASATGTMGSTSSSVVFNLGENSQNERTMSSTSLSPVSTSSTNGHHLGSAQSHHGPPKTGYNQCMSYPPYNFTTTSSSVLSSGLSKTGSSGNLLSNNTIPRGPGTSSSKIYNSASVSHLSKSTSPLPGSSAAAVTSTPSDGTNAKFVLNDSGDFFNNNIMASNLSGANFLSSGGISHSTSMVITPQSLNHGNHQEDSDAASLDSLPRSLSQAALSRARLTRSPELDHSMDSLPSSKDGRSEGFAEKKSKKKKFLPNFLIKGKGKQKTT